MPARLDKLSLAHISTRRQKGPRSACSPKEARDEHMRRWLAENLEPCRTKTLLELHPEQRKQLQATAAKNAQPSPRGSLSPTPTYHAKVSVLSDEFHCVQPNGGGELAELLGLKKRAVRSGHVLALQSAKTWRERTASYDQKVGRPKSSRQPARPRLHLEPRDTARNVVRVIDTSSVINTEHSELLKLLQTAVLSGHVVLVGAEEKWDAPQQNLSSVTAAVAQPKKAFVALFRGWF